MLGKRVVFNVAFFVLAWHLCLLLHGGVSLLMLSD